MNNRQNIAKAKVIEQKNKKRLLAVNPKLDEKIPPTYQRYPLHSFEEL